MRPTDADERTGQSLRITAPAVFAFGAVLLLAGFVAGYAVGRNRPSIEASNDSRAEDVVVRKSDRKIDEGVSPSTRVDQTPLEKEVRERAAKQELKDLNDGDALQKAYLRKLKRDYDRLGDAGRNSP